MQIQGWNSDGECQHEFEQIGAAGSDWILKCKKCGVVLKKEAMRQDHKSRLEENAKRLLNG